MEYAIIVTLLFFKKNGKSPELEAWVLIKEKLTRISIFYKKLAQGNENGAEIKLQGISILPSTLSESCVVTRVMRATGCANEGTFGMQ